MSAQSTGGRGLDNKPESKIKREPSDDAEDIAICKICAKGFSQDTALTNHVKLEHFEEYNTGDPAVWTKLTKPKLRKRSTRVPKNIDDVISEMKPTAITSLASKDVSYIILKSNEMRPTNIQPAGPKKTRAPREKVVVTRDFTVGPFDCLHPLATCENGICHRVFHSCCEYSIHFRDEHIGRRKGLKCQVCEKPLASTGVDPFACETCGAWFDGEEGLSLHKLTVHEKEKKHVCHCGKRFKEWTALERHLRWHRGERPFTCVYCSKAFSQKAGLEKHIRTHTKEKPYICVICKKGFTEGIHLKRHMRTHTQVEPYKCEYCDRRFKQSTNLEKHLKSQHKASKLKKNPSNKYNEIVQVMVKEEVDETDDGTVVTGATEMENAEDLGESEADIINNVCCEVEVNPLDNGDEQANQESEDSEDIIFCGLCSESFACETDLTNHMMVEHIDLYRTEESSLVRRSTVSQITSPSQIKIVNKQPVTEASVKTLASEDVEYILIKSDDRPKPNHGIKRRRAATARRRPQKNKNSITEKYIGGPFECFLFSNNTEDGICHRKFTSCCEYSKHFKQEHSKGRKWARCQVCEKQLIYYTGTPMKPYVCQTCGECFEREENLVAHKSAVHDEKRHVCYCGKRFKHSNSLEQHHRWHKGERPFRCEHCPKTFSQKAGLVQHARTHTKEKPYICVICSKGFAQGIHLKLHMRTHTLVEPYICGFCDKRFKQSANLEKHLKSHHRPSNLTNEEKIKYNEVIEDLVSKELEEMDDGAILTDACEIEYVEDLDENETDIVSNQSWEIELTPLDNDVEEVIE